MAYQVLHKLQKWSRPDGGFNKYNNYAIITTFGPLKVLRKNA